MRQREPLGIEFSVLGLLDRQPRHGYDLHQALQDQAGLGLVWRLKQGHVYALLNRLESEGLVASHVEGQDCRPPRKVYSLTQQGRLALEAWRISPVGRGRQFRQEYLAKLYFAMCEGPAAAEVLLSMQRTACASWPEVQEEAGEGDSFAGLVEAFRAGQVKAALEWLDWCRQTMADKQPDAFIWRPADED